MDIVVFLMSWSNMAMNSNEIMLLAGLVVLAAWMSVVTYMYWRQQQLFKKLTEGVSKRDLKTILQSMAKETKKMGRDIDEMQKSIAVIQEDSRSHFQKVGFVRFNPFSDTGGDQSFCLCLLDEDNNGVVVTSLHSREQTRIYGKRIKNSKGENVTFFEEEKKALDQALKAGNKKGKK